MNLNHTQKDNIGFGNFREGGGGGGGGFRDFLQAYSSQKSSCRRKWFYHISEVGY